MFDQTSKRNSRIKMSLYRAVIDFLRKISGKFTRYRSLVGEISHQFHPKYLKRFNHPVLLWLWCVLDSHDVTIRTYVTTIKRPSNPIKSNEERMKSNCSIPIIISLSVFALKRKKPHRSRLSSVTQNGHLKFG